MHRLGVQMANSVRVSLASGIKTFKKRINPEAMYAAWKSGDYQKVTSTIPWQSLHTDLSDSGTKLRGAASKAAETSLVAVNKPLKNKLRFDTDNPRIKRYLDTRTASMVTNIETEAKEVIRSAVTRSFDKALTPSQVAGRIKGSIGILPRHELALEGYRNGLETQGISPDRIESLSDRYADRLLDYRANMIARTETKFAQNYGQLFVWQQGAAEGYIDRNSSQKVWVVDGDPCEVCEPMDGESVGLDEVWILPDGTSAMVPTDSHPHCMCNMVLSFGGEETAE